MTRPVTRILAAPAGVAFVCARGVAVARRKRSRVQQRWAPVTARLQLVGLECEAKRRRQGNIKKHDGNLVLGCAPVTGGPPPLPPFEIDCVRAVYEANTTGRFGLPVSTTQRSAGAIIGEGFTLDDPMHVRIDGFDGTTRCASISPSPSSDRPSQ